MKGRSGRGHQRWYNPNMPASVLVRQVAHWHIETPVFQGPLDLLLYLIERAELDITKIALAQVTEQYLAYLEHLEERSPDEVSAFVVIAAKLVQIKSEALLPRPPQREPGEEDPGEALVAQLQRYKAFKERAVWLAERHAAGLRAYLRTAPPPRPRPATPYLHHTLDELIAAAHQAFAITRRQPLRTVVTPPRVTIRQKIRDLVQALRRYRRVAFMRQILRRTRSRLEAVVAFLALLELVKRRLVTARQSDLFGEIEVEPLQNLERIGDITSEFGE